MSHLITWSNKKRFGACLLIASLFLSLVYALMDNPVKPTEPVFYVILPISVIPTTLIAFWLFYYLNSNLQVGAPEYFKQKGYEDFGGVPKVLINTKEKEIVIVDLGGRLKASLQIRQWFLSNLLSVACHKVAASKINKMFSSNVLRCYVEMKFDGQEEIQKVGFRASEEAESLIVVLNNALVEIKGDDGMRAL